MMHWNQDREAFATTGDTGSDIYSGQIKSAVNILQSEVFGSKLYHNYRPPRKYTGKLFSSIYYYIIYVSFMPNELVGSCRNCT